MPLTLFAHPFSSYCQKVLVALWENETPFAYRDLEEPGVRDDLVRLWPIAKFPVLVDGDRTIVESSVIIEHLDRHHPGTVRFIPEEPEVALEVRLLDRVFDQHVMNAMQGAVNEALRKTPDRLDEAKATAAAALADCAAAPALFYADWVHPIGAAHPTLRAYRARLLARPSFARAVEEGRRYRHYFPLGAPDRD
jgi:glutathione S-transferase